MTTDAVLTISSQGVYDFSIDANGDIETEDFFDTAILYSIFGERRALPSEMAQPQRRRGWIGNEGKDFENGSKIWLIIEQNRTSRTTFNKLESEIFNALSWLVTDNLALRIENISVELVNNVVMAEVTIKRFNSEVEPRYYELWRNTGVR